MSEHDPIGSARTGGLKPGVEPGMLRDEPQPVVPSGTIAAIRDPVVVILVLAGTFDGLSGNPLHSILLFATAFALIWDHVAGRPEDVSAPNEFPASVGRGPTVVVVARTFVFALIVGTFGRYSLPATLAVVAPGAVAIGIAWRGPLHLGRDPGKLDPVGAVSWAAVLVAAGLWELAALLLQPSLTQESYSHPTLSFLTDPVLASHAGRSVALFVWLALGMFLLER